MFTAGCMLRTQFPSIQGPNSDWDYIVPFFLTRNSPRELLFALLGNLVCYSISSCTAPTTSIELEKFKVCDTKQKGVSHSHTFILLRLSVCLYGE